jgi:threonine/homoserine/homoserine lactone efflux protein
MTLGAIAAFWAISMLFVLTPGADWAYAISAGLRKGILFPALAGLLLGHLVATLVVAAGVGALVASIPFALTGLTIVGAIYLLWLGVGVLKNPPLPSAGDDAGGRPSMQWMWQGFCVSGLNPKVILLFLALLPQFADKHGTWSLPVQMMALGMVHVANCAVIYAIVAAASKLLLRSRPRAAVAVGRMSGAAMIAIGAILMAGPLRGLA